MKKEYMMPQMVAVEITYSGMLCLVGSIEGEATEPAFAPDQDMELGEDQDLGW